VSNTVATYANAPLKYVLFAAELSAVSLLSETSVLDQIHRELRDDLPVREDVSGALVPNPDGGLTPSSGTRFVDADQQRAVFVGPLRVAVDTTRYSTFREFSGFVARVLEVVASVAPGRACRRLGVRYVDEIRIPGAVPGNVEQWRGWIDDSLFPGVAFRPAAQQGQREIAGVVDDTGDDGFGVRFSWHTGTGHAVQPVGPLIVPNASDPGPYFALDTDSYWTTKPGTGVLGLGDPAMLDRIDRLHEPVQAYFEMTLTDRLREEVLGPVTT
jgi:uncharacterized protein (TIGR04255 family)